MKRFADLYTALDSTTKTTEKVEALANYLSAVPPAEAAWAVYFLSGRKPSQVVSAPKLSAWAVELAGIPAWLFDESYDAVGDVAETIALLLGPSTSSSDRPLDEWVERWLLPLRGMELEQQRTTIRQAWAELDARQRFVWNKLLTGAFRVGVSQQLVVRALAELSGLDPAGLSHRLMGEWTPTPEFFAHLLARDTAASEISRPYPFILAHPLEGDPAALGEISGWRAEWKWDGIRAQLIRRAGQSFIWSRGEELITDRYPELQALCSALPDGTVLDGEILPWKDGAVLPFASLQRRIGRKSIGRKLLQEIPVILMAYDLLELGGEDMRSQTFDSRRLRLEQLVQRSAPPGLLLSPALATDSWEELARLRDESRARNVEGLMLKRRDSPYRVGRQRGDWWKWKVQPYSIDAVLIYAQPGHGKRASLFTDYTFAVWDGDKLVPVAKAYSGLTDAEIRQVDTFVRGNTLEKFGPVRTVKPELVFELGFEGIQRSARHKSGIAVRFPRMLRWRTDKSIAEADTLETIRALLPPEDAGCPREDEAPPA
jgi:DNA ligase-1